MSTRLRVLYIDDDAGLCRMVQKSLERQNFVVEIATSGPAGLQRLRTPDIDVVALDHHMPGQNGLEALALIAELPDPPPVVYVTGEAEGRVAVAALKAGAVDYVIKEVNGEFLPLLAAAISAAADIRQVRRAREQAEMELRASRDRFEALATERAMLIQEINHRVANSLQLVSSFLRIQRIAATSDDAKTALSSAIARVGAIGHVHRQLYVAEDVRLVALSHYIEHLVADLAQVETGAKVRLLVEADPISTPTDRAISIGIIVTELVINALKYAYPQGVDGTIRVSCRSGAEEGDIVLVVEDDGAGIAANAGPPKSGLGQRIIGMMASKLGARIEHDTAHQGTRFVIQVPGKPPAEEGQMTEDAGGDEASRAPEPLRASSAR